MRVSIVTVHRNEFRGLEQTMQSVSRLRDEIDLQWVVIDGLSSWPSGDLADRVRATADVFVSESDSGLYDAMNKGVASCTGEFVSFMNAGDKFCSDAAELFSLCRDDGVDLFCFDSFEASTSGTEGLKRARSARWLWYGMPGHHQAMVFRRSALPVLPYDLKYRIAADYALVCRLASEGRRVSTINRPLCVFELGGASTQHRRLGLSEQQLVRKEVLGISPVANQALFWAKRCVLAVRFAFPSVYSLFRYRVRPH